MQNHIININLGLFRLNAFTSPFSFNEFNFYNIAQKKAAGEEKSSSDQKGETKKRKYLNH